VHPLKQPLREHPELFSHRFQSVQAHVAILDTDLPGNLASLADFCIVATVQQTPYSRTDTMWYAWAVEYPLERLWADARVCPYITHKNSFFGTTVHQPGIEIGRSL
jgi:hypothetical protein